MIEITPTNAEGITVDYQTGATIERTIEVEGTPITVDLGPDGRVVSVNLEAESYEVRPVRVLMREG